MKKIDLHIHTLPTRSDPSLIFDLVKLKEYVEKLEIDCIAVTNHNIFDLDQFNTISKNLNICVLPGIEINLENSHILLISERDELLDFDSKCQEIKNIIDNNDFITIDELKKIFIDLKKYLLIPHYDKNPKVNQGTLSELSGYISAGEVSSPKKFQYCIKDSSSLVPVLFSDLRIKKDLDIFSTRQTFINLNEISLKGIKTCLLDKNKVFLTKKSDRNLFQVLENGLELSTGLNIILGSRSSGKTHLLKEINKLHNISNNVNFIEQFSLVETDENEDIKKFNKILSAGQSSVSETYLKEFRNVVNDIVKIDILENNKNIDNYLDSLLKNASENEKLDSYSKAKMFNETLFADVNYGNLKKIIEAIVLLINNIQYRKIIDNYVSLDKLKELAVNLMIKYSKDEERHLKEKWLNDLILNIKNELKRKTSTTPIEDIDLHKIISDNLKINRFNKIVELVRKEKEIKRKNVGGFNIVASTENFSGAGSLKKKSSGGVAFSDAFANYRNPFKYLESLKEIELLEESEYYKYFIDIKYKIINKDGYEVSGGERSEFNLLQKIDGAIKFDMLLIDEPESSFDNLFLNNEVNSLIKDISKYIPVIIVTHNNTVGASIKPDYVIYTQKEIINDSVQYNIFSGYPSDNELKSLNGKVISNYNIMLDCLEAGDKAYKERKQSYEILRD